MGSPHGWGSCILALVTVWLGFNALIITAVAFSAWRGDRRDRQNPPPIVVDDGPPMDISEFTLGPKISYSTVPVKRTWAKEMGLRKPEDQKVCQECGLSHDGLCMAGVGE